MDNTEHEPVLLPLLHDEGYVGADVYVDTTLIEAVADDFKPAEYMALSKHRPKRSRVLLRGGRELRVDLSAREVVMCMRAQRQAEDALNAETLRNKQAVEDAWAVISGFLDWYQGKAPGKENAPIAEAARWRDKYILRSREDGGEG